MCLGIQKENMTKYDLFMIKCKIQTNFFLDHPV